MPYINVMNSLNNRAHFFPVFQDNFSDSWSENRRIRRKLSQYEIFLCAHIPASYFLRAILLNLSQVTNGLRLVISLRPLENYVYHKISIHFDIVDSICLK